MLSIRDQLSQPLTTQHFSLLPIAAHDFQALQAVASDPLIWEQHPDHNRWRPEVFKAFFASALANELTCFIIKDVRSEATIGSTRFYGLDGDLKRVRLGFTFLSRAYWGTGANREIKDALLSRAFEYCESVCFDIGPENYRSIAAVKKLGAQFTHVESPTKAVYVLRASDWSPLAS